MRPAPPLPWAALCAATALALGILSLGLGAVSIPPAQVVAILADRVGLDLGIPWAPTQAAALIALRLPRVLLAAGVGASLGLSGAALQGLFRNPLADPHLLGISTGGAVGAALTILLGLRGAPAAFEALGPALVPMGAFVGGLVALGAVLAMAGGIGRARTAHVLLGGVAVNALGGAALGLLLHLSDDAALRSITLWTLGSLAGASWTALAVALPLMGVAAAVCLREAGALNALLLGEAEARHLGVGVRGVQRRLLLAVSLGVGSAVALTGVISFVGLVVPHVFRLLAGPDHARLLPGAALLGAALLLGADLGARTLISPQELPVGVVTASLGAPFFVWLLRREGRR